MAKKTVTWATCRGRNTWDHPLEVPDDMGVECLNVNLNLGELGAKRSGMAIQALDTSLHIALTGQFLSLGRFVPAQDETAAELHGYGSGTISFTRFASGAVIPAGGALTLTDAIAVGTALMVQLNNKLYYFYGSGVNRMHVYDPQVSTTAIRRAGLQAPAAPTVANSAGGGAYPATQRWYAEAVRLKVGSKIIAQSELSAGVAFTPDGSHASAVVTKAANTGDGETHWVLFASADSISGPFYEIAETVVGTTTSADSATPSSYSTNTAAPTVGSNYPFPSCKFPSTDGTHLFGLGVYETSAGASVAPVNGRLYFTPAIGSTTHDDDERINNTSGANATTGWIDLSVGARGVDVGLSEWVQGVMFAFQSSAIYMILPTNAARVPFRSVLLTKTLGAVSHQSIFTGFDESGNPCVYFWSPQNGPNRITLGGDIQWLGKDIYYDIVASVNLSANAVVSHGVYDAPNHQGKWWLAMGSENSPDGTAMAVFHSQLGRLERGESVRGGWAKWTGNIAKANCSLQFAKSFATVTRPLANVTYVGSRATNVQLGVQDGTATQDGVTTNYQAYVESKAFDMEPMGRRKRISEAYVLVSTNAAVTIRSTFTKDWGTEARTDDLLLTAVGSETYIRKRCQAIDMADAVTFQIRIGDSAAQNVALWSAERFQAIYDVTETS